MSKFAWVENGKIRDVAHDAPDHIYAPEVAKHYNTVVPDDAANGDAWNGSRLTKPAVVVAEAQPAPEEKPEGFTLAFTAEEKPLHALFSQMLESARRA